MIEEREMKKNIKWLKEKIGALPCADTIFNSSGSRYIDSAVSIMAVYDLIDQLDESETNSQIDKLANFIMSEVEGEPSQSQGAVDTAIRIIKSYQNQEALSQKWLDENKSSWAKLKVDRYYIPVEKLQNLLVPKQKLPVIPKFVADYIQSSKDTDLTLFAAMEKLIEGYENKVNNWLWDGSGDDSFQVFAKAWLAYPNIVVEEEQKYIIKIAERDFMVMDDDGVMYPTDINVPKYKYQFTEQEIKDYDERYIPFMVPVDEVNND